MPWGSGVSICPGEVLGPQRDEALYPAHGQRILTWSWWTLTHLYHPWTPSAGLWHHTAQPRGAYSLSGLRPVEWSLSRVAEVLAGGAPLGLCFLSPTLSKAPDHPLLCPACPPPALGIPSDHLRLILLSWKHRLSRQMLYNPPLYRKSKQGNICGQLSLGITHAMTNLTQYRHWLQ